MEGHNLSDANCWDVTQGQNGKYIAWYEEENGYYNVTIAGEGGVVANSDSRYLFGNIGYGVENEEVTIEGLENLDTGLVTSMTFMFCNMKAENLDLSSFDTSNVTSMNNMFTDCSNLTQLDLSNFNTSNVTTMYYMFYRCNNLTQLDVSNFDTSNVTSMQDMFSGCSNITSLDVSNFDTSNVINMGSMFYKCNNLTQLNIGDFDTSKVNIIWYMFAYDSKLEKIDISKFNVSNVTDCIGVFINVPTTVEITTNQSTADWLKEKFPTYTNIKIVN